MGVFGEGGTGKSRFIQAIQAWFAYLSRSEELVTTATTGTAAIGIGGATLHSTVGIPIEKGDSRRVLTPTRAKMALWANRSYLIIDEVSMLDTDVISSLNAYLGSLKSNPDAKFGGVNIVFLGDFLQLPTVNRHDLYNTSDKCLKGHRLWRSLNAVVLLHQQMRQADDLQYAALLGRLRLRVPTDDDVRTLLSRVNADISNIDSVPVIVRRHNVRRAINYKKLHSTSESTGTPIIYCIAGVSKPRDMWLPEIFRIKAGDKDSPCDAVLSVIRGAPLVILRNVNKSLGISLPVHC
jgi:PIF1-like helicase